MKKGNLTLSRKDGSFGSTSAGGSSYPSLNLGKVEEFVQTKKELFSRWSKLVWTNLVLAAISSWFEITVVYGVRCKAHDKVTM